MSLVSPIEFYQQNLPNLKKVRDEYRTNCPFHDDSTPSFYINNDGLFYCFGCGVGGNLQKFAELSGISLANVPKYETTDFVEPEYKFQERISEKLVTQYHKNLLNDRFRLMYVLRERRIALFIIKKFQIGFDAISNRYVFPIRDLKGKIKNLKFHNSDLIPKSYSLDGYGKPRLFPISSIYRKQIIICEGEFDCLLLHSLGINAITSTAGSRSWLREWSEFFSDREVGILYDSDEAGQNGCEDVYENIRRTNRNVRKLHFPDAVIKTYGKVDVSSYVQNGFNIIKLIGNHVQTRKI